LARRLACAKGGAYPFRGPFGLETLDFLGECCDLITDGIIDGINDARLKAHALFVRGHPEGLVELTGKVDLDAKPAGGRVPWRDIR
jgi:hypothetical protein